MRPEPRSVPGLAEALPALESSLHEDASPRNRMCVAEALWLAGRSDDSVSLLEPWVGAEPEAIAPRVLLAWAYEDLGRLSDAARVWSDVEALDPANPFVPVESPAPTAEPVLEAPPAADASGEPTDSEAPVRTQPDVLAPLGTPESQAEPERPLTREELAEIPPDPLYSATLAEIFAKQGFEEKAIQILQEVLRQHPDRSDLASRMRELERRLPGGSTP